MWPDQYTFRKDSVPVVIGWGVSLLCLYDTIVMSHIKVCICVCKVMFPTQCQCQCEWAKKGNLEPQSEEFSKMCQQTNYGSRCFWLSWITNKQFKFYLNIYPRPTSSRSAKNLPYNKEHKTNAILFKISKFGLCKCFDIFHVCIYSTGRVQLCFPVFKAAPHQSRAPTAYLSMSI